MVHGQKEATQPTMDLDLSSLWKPVKCLTMVSDRRFVPHVINKKQTKRAMNIRNGIPSTSVQHGSVNCRGIVETVT
jgi:hypothetical protein